MCYYLFNGSIADKQICGKSQICSDLWYKGPIAENLFDLARSAVLRLVVRQKTCLFIFGQHSARTHSEVRCFGLCANFWSPVTHDGTTLASSRTLHRCAYLVCKSHGQLRWQSSGSYVSLSSSNMPHWLARLCQHCVVMTSSCQHVPLFLLLEMPTTYETSIY